MLIMMDRIELLRTFIAVAETGTFTAAAERLGITPQLASKYVRALEDQLGSQLFVRSTRSVRLTETGAACRERCLRLIEDFDDLSADIRQEHREPQGRLRISAPSTFGEKYLVPLLPDFTELYPKVLIDLDLTDRFVNLVEEGYDVALRIGMLEDSSLIARRITSSPVLICASPEYLGRHGRPETPDDLANHRCVVDANFREKDIWPFRLDGVLTKVKVNEAIRVNSANAVQSLLLSHAGIGLCPAYVVEESVQSGALVRLLENYQVAELGVYALYLENRYLSAKIRAFVDLLAKRLA